MPTGYTCDVADGKISDFPTFAMRCARAFGAMVMMRDAPMDAEVPERFEASDYNAKRLEEAKERLSSLRAMTAEEVAKAHADAVAKAEEYYAKRKAEVDAQRARYVDMLQHVQDWEPPTAEHVGLKDFMRQQLVESIEFDCSGPTKREFPSPEKWHADEIAKAEWDVGYHAKSAAEEIERTKGRNEWVAALRKSLETAP